MNSYIVSDILKRYEEHGFFKVKVEYYLVGGGIIKEKILTSKNKYQVDNIKRGHIFECEED